MKKIKIMLLSLALFAVVGGALAFRAKYLDVYCSAAPNGDGTCPANCPNTYIAKKTLNSPGVFQCYTTAVAGQANHCPNACIATSTRFTFD